MTHKFLADSMVGGVARKMRILGYDTEYYPHNTAGQTARLAAATGRIILTSNGRLALRRGIPRIICAATEEDIMKSVIDMMRIRHAVSAERARCPICNGIQKPLYDAVRQCVMCGRAYWDGTHMARIREELFG